MTIPQEIEIERLKGAVASLTAATEKQDEKLSEQDEEISALKIDLNQTQKDLLLAKNELATFIAQLNAGWKVLIFLGSFTLGVSYFIYNIFELRK